MKFTPHTRQFGHTFKAQVKAGGRQGVLQWECNHIHYNRLTARLCAKWKVCEMKRDAEGEAFMNAGK